MSFYNFYFLFEANKFYKYYFLIEALNAYLFAPRKLFEPFEFENITMLNDLMNE